ncbi:hypothetical protein [Thalassovita aquimarina]|uniref:Uncharacterized protein n=1 Tax=Thalassovita aquimarina TaxID=2785917 RepID=A0ABS5HL80_9RHOB|nr:hypothetical protein [Thalassovita aquimarina]MBR9649727.1 hypothetical protein [Thalassovita aquimarina]
MATFIAGPSGLSPAETIPPLTAAHWTGIAAASALAFTAFVGFGDTETIAAPADLFHLGKRATAGDRAKPQNRRGRERA